MNVPNNRTKGKKKNAYPKDGVIRGPINRIYIILQRNILLFVALNKSKPLNFKD